MPVESGKAGAPNGVERDKRRQGCRVRPKAAGTAKARPRRRRPPPDFNIVGARSRPGVSDMLEPAMGEGADGVESSVAAARDPPFQINPDLDLDEISATYSRDGRVRIFGLLSEGALALYECL